MGWLQLLGRLPRYMDNCRGSGDGPRAALGGLVGGREVQGVGSMGEGANGQTAQRRAIQRDPEDTRATPGTLGNPHPPKRRGARGSPGTPGAPRGIKTRELGGDAGAPCANSEQQQSTGTQEKGAHYTAVASSKPWARSRGPPAVASSPAATRASNARAFARINLMLSP